MKDPSWDSHHDTHDLRGIKRNLHQYHLVAPQLILPNDYLIHQKNRTKRLIIHSIKSNKTHY